MKRETERERERQRESAINRRTLAKDNPIFKSPPSCRTEEMRVRGSKIERGKERENERERERERERENIPKPCGLLKTIRNPRKPALNVPWRKNMGHNLLYFPHQSCTSSSLATTTTVQQSTQEALFVMLILQE